MRLGGLPSAATSGESRYALSTKLWPELDLYDYLLRGDTKNDVMLARPEDGDIAGEFALNPYDRVFVRRIANFELDNMLANPAHRDNVMLLPGDSMAVPEYNPVVVVQGAVTSPSTVLYRQGAGLDY